MRLTVVAGHGRILEALATPDGATATLEDLGIERTEVLPALADPAAREEIASRIPEAAGDGEPLGEGGRAWPFRPRAILGIGLNYRDHAEDLSAPLPEEPAFFTKMVRTAVPDGSTVLLPPESERVTAEGELALVIGRRCWRVGADEALEHVAGACAILDQTAEDVLQRNPRFLTRSKNWPSFFVVGSELVSLDELTAERPLADLEVSTRRNGEAVTQAPISRMIFPPAEVVSFLSHVLPLEPGDVLSTGTPGALVVSDGDRVEGEVEGLGRVQATVRRPDARAYADEVSAQLSKEGWQAQE